MYKAFGLKWSVVMAGAMLLVLAVACGETVVKEVPVERIVEKVVTEEVVVEVERVVEVEKEVVKEVKVEVPVEVVKEVEVIKEVPKVITEEKVVVKEVEVLVEVPAKDPGWLMRAAEPNPKYGGITKAALPATTPHFDVQLGAAVYFGWYMPWDNLTYWNLADGYRTIAPMLASSWEMSSDGTAYTFHLRENVKWTDGSDFTADDVVATWDRVINPPEGINPAPKSFFTSLVGVSADDSLTVTMSLSRPDPTFVETASSASGWTMAIYQKEALEANNFDMRKDLFSPGTGPYLVKEHREGELWKFEPNPDYYNPHLPYMDEVWIIHTAAWIDRGAAVLTGQADWSWNVAGATWEEGKKRPELISVESKVLGVGAYALNTKHPPLDDPKVRRAMRLAFNQHEFHPVYESVVNPLYTCRYQSDITKYSMPIDEIEQIPGYRKDTAADIALARELMAEAGYSDGFKLKFVVPSSAAFAEVVEPSVAAQFKKALNIDIELEVLERSLLPNIRRSGDFDILRAPIGTGIRDMTGSWTATMGTGGSVNFTGYSNPEFDAIMTKLQTEPDDVERVNLFREAAVILDEDSPLITSGCPIDLPMGYRYVKGVDFGNKLFNLWGRWETIWHDK